MIKVAKRDKKAEKKHNDKKAANRIRRDDKRGRNEGDSDE